MGGSFFVDSLFTQESTVRNHAALNQQGYLQRKLNDGRTTRREDFLWTSSVTVNRCKAWGGRAMFNTPQTTFYGLVYPAISA